VKLQGFEFSRVIIDEASQAKEAEVLQSIKTARQVVMIGDQKQLGPVFKG
jgi:superfamily I DNA and/or RNA helicase